MASKKPILAPKQLYLYEGKEVVTTQKIGPYIIKGILIMRLSINLKLNLLLILHILLYLGQPAIVKTIKTDSIIITPIDPTGKHLSYPNEDIKEAVQIDDSNTIQYQMNTFTIRR
jgi:hypothetical protein